MASEASTLPPLGRLLGWSPGGRPAKAMDHERASELFSDYLDGEIAAALYISRRTAATHIRHIYDKLGVSTRAAAAAWAVRNGIA